MANVHYRIQLKNGSDGTIITTTGGTCHVALAGLPDKATLYDSAGAALTNPIQMTTGTIDFYVVDTTATVDLYIMAPGGQFVVSTGVKPSGSNEITVGTSQKIQQAIIPFSIVDSTAATEKDTGFDLPAQCAVLDRLHGCGLTVTALHSGKTIDVGTGEVTPAETGGDANGFIAASSLTTAVMVTGTNGALFSSNAPYNSDANAAKSITYTLSSATTTAKGFIRIPYRLA